MSNKLSTFFHRLGDACACDGEISADELKELVEQELSTRQEVYDIKADIRQMQEVIGFLGMHLKSLEGSASSKCNAKQISMSKDK